jgi:hypothetical protein
MQGNLDGNVTINFIWSDPDRDSHNGRLRIQSNTELIRQH